MDQDHETPAAPAETESPASIWSILAGVFHAPAAAFTAYLRKPRILIPLIVLLIVGGAIGYSTAGYNSQMQYDMLKKSTVIPPAQLEQMRDGIENPARVMGAVGPIVAITIVTMIEALLAWFLGGVVFGGKVNFKPVWGVGLLAGVIAQVGGLIRVPLVVASNNPKATIGLAAMFPTKDFSSIMYSYLFYFDAFAIWSIIVAAIGYALLFKISKGKGFAVAIISAFCMITLMIGLSTVGLGFAGVDISFF